MKVISPKCSKDQRSRVVEAYCRILGLAPTFRVAGNDYANFLADTLNWLWRTAADVDKPASVKAGLYIFQLALPILLRESAYVSHRLYPGLRIRIRSDPLIFGLSDPLLFSSDPDPTCENGYLKLFPS